MRKSIKMKVRTVYVCNSVERSHHHIRVKSEMSLLSCPRARQLHHIESLHPPRHPVTAAVFRDTTEYTHTHCFSLSTSHHTHISRGSTFVPHGPQSESHLCYKSHKIVKHHEVELRFETEDSWLGLNKCCEAF